MNGDKPSRKLSLPAYSYLQTVGLALLFFIWLRHFYHDDALISLRYARNLLDGQGMTWQNGEHIEGYTNFLFIILCAGLNKLGIDLVAASRLLGIVSYAGIVASIAFYTRDSRRSADPAARMAAALAVAIVGSSLPLISWALGGLEGNVYTLFITLAACLLLSILRGHASAKAYVLAGLAMALATLTRPEGMIFSAFIAGFMVLAWLLRWLPKDAWKSLTLMVLLYLAIFAPYSIWRVNYFGDWPPNTYYAKAFNVPVDMLLTLGVAYVVGLFFMPPMLPTYAGVLSFMALRRRQFSRPLLFLSLWVGLYYAYIARVGGDFMEYQRFALPTIPLLALGLYHLFLLASRFLTAQRLREIAGSLLFFLVFQVGLVGEEKGVMPSYGLVSGVSVADYIKSHWPKGSTVAINPAGALPYYAPDYSYIDMLGLLDKHIARQSPGEVIVYRFTPEQIKLKIEELGQAKDAQVNAKRQRILANPAGYMLTLPTIIGHMKGDGAYVLSRKPDYIILGHAWGNDIPLFKGDYEVLNQPDFLRDYRKVEIYIDPPADMVPYLKRWVELKAEKPLDFVGLKLNPQNQLRFIYYQRKK